MLSTAPRCDSAFRVSSVLNRNTRQFGKKHLFDQDEETCWNSDQVRHPLPGLSIPGVNQNQGGKSKRFPVGPVVETVISLLSVWVQPLILELRSYKLCCTAKRMNE